MTFAFATLAFLAAAWFAIVVFGMTIEDYGAKIRAALAGGSAAQAPFPTMIVRVRPRYPSRRPLRLQPRPALRAAA